MNMTDVTKGPPMKPALLPTTPEPIAPDTWLIPTLAADPAGGYLGAHSAVIRAQEPVVLDTSVLFGRDEWLENVFSIVEPEDVRWIFLSHDDHDHLGNLDPVLDRCPNATLLANYAMVGRLFGDVELPLQRMRWINVGESITVGDRELVVVRPPMFDSPSSRGLFDTRTGMLWAADSFGTSFPGAVYDAADIPDEVYEPSFELLNLLNTPWLEWVDQARFDAHVATTESLPLTVVASAHGPVHRGDRIADAFRRTRALAGTAPAEQPGQDVLELLCAMLATAAV
jgi:flavorubredoxin